MFDSIVIGGGIAGLMTARELMLAGQRVCILERGEVGRECSWAGGGILSPLYPWKEPPLLQPFIQFSQSCYPDLVGQLHEHTGIDPEWIPSGLLILEPADQTAAYTWLNKNNKSFESLSQDQLLLMEPAINRTIQHAIKIPGVSQIRNPRLLAALKKELLQTDVSITEHTIVNRLTVSQQLVRSVETSRGSFTADNIVIAAGAWSGEILHGITPRIYIKPYRGQMLCYRADDQIIQHILLLNDIYIIPRKDGHLLVGSTVEDVGFDKSTTEKARITLEDTAVIMLPSIRKYPLIKQWSGLRPGTPHGFPYTGKHPEISNLFFNTGHHRHGILLAPATSRLVADLMLGRSPSLPRLDFPNMAETGLITG